MATASAPAASVHSEDLRVPDSWEQVVKLTRYQLREYLRSRRFVVLLSIVFAIGMVVTAVVAHFRGALVADNLGFYASFWGSGSSLVIVLAAVFFGGDAIAGEFQNKTGYFLMGLPIRRATVYVGKYLAAFLASVAVLVLYFLIIFGNGIYYFGTGAVPWQAGVSLVLAVVYLAAVLGATFMFSSLFKTSAYGFVLTAILFLFGFSLLQTLIADLVRIEPWMVISYASSAIGNVFSPNVSWAWTGSAVVPGGEAGVRAGLAAVYIAGVGEAVLIMLAYFVLTAAAGLFLFEREEFT